jgi:hypothetical protein
MALIKGRLKGGVGDELVTKELNELLTRDRVSEMVVELSLGNNMLP